MMKCPKCNAEIPNDAAVCEYCGTKINDKTENQQVQQPVQQQSGPQDTAPVRLEPKSRVMVTQNIILPPRLEQRTLKISRFFDILCLLFI